MYKDDLALNNLQVLICHKLNQTKKCYFSSGPIMLGFYYFKLNIREPNWILLVNFYKIFVLA